jgi:hypothetical protein
VIDFAPHGPREESPSWSLALHRARHRALHEAFDELLADFLTHHRSKRPSTTTIEELLMWSHGQTQDPTDPG